MPGEMEQITLPSGKDRRSRPRWRRIAAVLVRRALRKQALFIAGAALPLILIALVAGGVYIHYARVIDRCLTQNPFEDSSNVYAAPLIFSVNDPLTAQEIEADLGMAGYRADAGGHRGTWRTSGNRIDVVAASASQPPAAIFVNATGIQAIRSGAGEVSQYNLGDPLLTSMTASREKRRLVAFSSIPPVLVHAVVSAEDKHFFQHAGLDLPRILKAAWVDFRHGRKAQGASTLTMQLVRGLWLDSDKRWRRKIAEALMTIHLERKWSKQQIFETYANQVFLGRQAAYNIQGFGEASRVFFGKPLRDIDLPEAALLAGMVQRPSYFNPVRNADRAKERRDRVLSLMRENGYISEAQYQSARDTPVHITPRSAPDGAGAPWFLDLVNDELQNRESQPTRSIYTTIDINLQRAADEAVANGMKSVDKLLAKKEPDGAHAQAVLIALDPHTGEIRALVGGRDYGHSQLNRALAHRPPGSVFKPFVYAAALNTAIAGGDEILTPASTVDDEPTTFWFNGEAYEPANFKHEVFGILTFRDALAKSDNVAAVQVAQTVGFRNVAAMARRCGLNGKIQPTPAMALGAYDVTPLELAGAYTVFANSGVHERPTVVALGGQTATARPTQRSAQALDPRIAWLMDSMLEEVMRSGTAAGVRSRGFILPAAGKTGTSRDGWFAGFTSQLLCVVWVGFDDYRELGLEGARSALPIWTDFMKQASRFGAYRKAHEFSRPSGIESAEICEDTGKLAGDFCDRTRNEYFVAGTVPTDKCDLHSFGTPQQTFSQPSGDEFNESAPASLSPGSSAVGNSAPQQP
jgi:penicillin-binding protein 1B